MKSNLAQKPNQEKHPSLSRDNSILKEFTTEDALSITGNGYKFSLAFKRILWNASDKKCAYCGDEIPTHKEMRVDHFIPKSRNGIECITNYVCSCDVCNSIKGSKSLEDFRVGYSLRNSILCGIIQPSQAKQLLELGIVLPMEIQDFYFEKIVDGGVL